MKTNEQIFEENYKLIFSYMNKNPRIAPNLEADDKEQILAIGLWKAVTTFNKEKDITFSTYAFKCMHNELCNTFRSKQQKFEQRYGTDNIIGYLDEPISTDEGSATLLDLIADKENDIDEYSDDELIRCFNDDEWLLKEANLTTRELCVLRKMGTTSMADAARELGLSRQSVFKARKKAISKIKEAYFKGEI